MVGLVLSVDLPLVLLQLYKIYVGPISFDLQMGTNAIVSVIAGTVLYLTFRSSARNAP